ncbi:acetamidase [Couchioplanes caeruleus subsp. caeruleus]|uniref:Acetamidase n=1 Tax=Couchioplanes caeruleus subsp. caeruleus TaxID=56427 RepID=A0A1K0GSH2_9ACTN|nr:acetamidase [Couchioplanes caeruleus subsp. caeruleus]
MHELTDASVGFTFGGRPAIAKLRPGDRLYTQTKDCFGGAVASIDDLPSQVCQFPYLNPVTGPFHIIGAQPGDTLAVHLVSLHPSVPYGWSSTFPHFGALTSTAQTATLQPPLEERVWRYAIDLHAQTVRYSARTSDVKIDLPLEPMLGTVGVAPAAGEVRMSIVPDRYGGNLDTPLLRAGSTLYLGVNEPGAMLSLGDGHARQGDGEVSGVAVEVAMDVVLAVDLIPGVYTPTPRLETDAALMSIGLGRPLEDAFRVAQHDLVEQIAAVTGLDLLDALQLVAQAGETRVGNVVDANYSMVARIAKRYLDGACSYAGVHAGLRSSRPVL